MLYSNKLCSHSVGFRAVARRLMGFQRLRVGVADDLARVNRFHIGTVGDQDIFVALTAVSYCRILSLGMPMP